MSLVVPGLHGGVSNCHWLCYTRGLLATDGDIQLLLLHYINPVFNLI